MRRRYINRIAVWKNESVSDSFGGNLNSSEQLASSWCNVRTLPKDKNTEYGLDVGSNAIKIRTRYREDLDYEQEGIYFVYKGKEFYPDSVTSVDIDKQEVEIIAHFTSLVEVVTPLVDTFDLTFDTTFR